MRTKYALLAIILIQTLCASVVGARGSAIVGRASLMDGTTFPCTLDVVLVTFANATSSLDSTDDYHLHDRPYGTNSGEQLTDRYTRRDFERLFSGGYDGLPDFVGTNQTVGAGHRLPEVFGSVRAYYDSVSNGVFQLHVRMINPVNGDYPRWVELPETKEHYAEISLRDRSMRTDDRARAMNDWFWDDAEAAAWDSVQSWNANITDYSIADLPNDTYDTARRLRHKVVYLYSGSTYDNNGLLHPQADGVTQTNVATGIPTFVSYRYVMGERQGFGDTEHGVDEFAGIGMHAHEIGHLLGLNHGGGNWTDPNRYGAERRRDRYGNTAAPNNVVTGGANQLGWTLMQGGGDQGPIMDEGYTHNGYYIAYRSCPNPINPFYLRDLGWLTPTEVRGPQNDYRIASGTTHRIDRGAVEFLLNRRTLQPFGGRYVSFYDYAAHIDEDDPRQGLMIWRRAFRSEFPLLIVADERRYRDSRDQDRQPIPADHIPEYHDMLSDPFAAGDINDPRTDNTEFDQDNVSAVTGLNTGAGLRQATSGVNRDPTSLNLALTNIAYDSTTDTITVDIYMARPSPPTNVTAVVSNGQMTLDWEAPSDPGPPPNYRYRQSTDGTWGRPIDVAETEVPIGRLVPSTAYAFEVWSVNPLGSSDRVSISPLMLEGPTAIAFPEVVAPEAGRRTVANYTATDPEGDMIEWSLAGTDTVDFVLSSDGQLTFQNDPNFEEPTDCNHPPDQEPPTDEGENNTYHLIIQARAGQQSAMLAVTVTVTDVDEPGVIVLSSRSPQVRVPLTATLADPDGGITGVSWQWQGQAPGATTWQTLLATSGTVQSRYTPQAAQVGWMLRAVVTAYRDTFGAGKRAESMATAPVAGVPGVPLHVMALPGDGQVVLQWAAAPANGSEITHYEVQWRVAASGHDWPGWSPVAGGGNVRNTTVPDLLNGTQYELAVRAVNGVGPGASVFRRATPQAARPISVSFGSESYQAFEGGAAALVMVQLSPPPSRSVSIPVVVSADEGTEAGDYTVAGLNEGKVVFAAGKPEQSFTIMANEDADSDDETVTLSFEMSGVASAPPKATVTLRDNDGTVALSSLSPQEGAQLTAEWTGPSSGITNPRWQWKRQSGPTSWTNVAGVSSQPQPWVSIYIPQAGDVGYPLRATVRYTDGGGSNQRAESATTAAVRAAAVEPEGPPLFSSDRVSYSVPAGSTDQQILPAAERAESYATVGTLPGYVAVNTTTRAITIQPENTHVGDAEFIWRARNPRGTDDLTVNITVTPLVETEYAYRASQTAPLFDASASGVPDHWSSGAITWTDAAPRVWRIGRTRPSGGSWSGWGPLKKYSERPAAAAIFYQRARRAPATPATQTGITLAVPSDWQTTPPPATDTQGVWTTTANRAQGAIPWLFTAPTQQTPPKIVQAPDPPRHFTAATGSPLTPGSIDLAWDSPTSGGTPTGYRVEYRFASGSWRLGATPTLTNASLVLSRAGALYQFRVRAENSVGNSGWVEATGTTSQSVPTETAYRLHTSGTTAPSFTASASGVPSGWSSSRQTPNPHARYEWEISRTRPTGGAWSRWGSASVVSRYTERRTAYRLHTSGTTAPSFTASASGVPSGWSSSRQTPNPHARYEWEISRTRPTGGSWSRWGGAEVVSTYTERRTAYRLHTSGTTAPSFTASASGVPSGWSSSRPTPNPHARYEWEISRTRPTGGSWSRWGGAEVVSTYTERRTAYRLHTSGTTAPSFSATASGVPSGWSSSRPTPNPHARYEWEISRTRPTGGAWSNWGGAEVVSIYTERRTAYRLHTSGTTAPAFTASASGVPSGWSSSRQTPNPHARYEWEISRSRPAGGAWSSWGGASVVARYTERQTAYKRNNSSTTAPAFSSTASGTPYGWSSSPPSPTSSNRYVWQISRTRPTGGSWSRWGSASVVARYTEQQTAYKRNNSSTTAPAFSSTASGTPYGWSSSPPSPTSSNRYVWQISRSRPAGGSWSSWGGASVVARYTERQTAYKRNDSSTTAPAFSSTASGTPYGWSSSPPSPTSSNRYVWRISRTRPAGGSWSSWGSASVVARYTERQTAYKRNDSSTTAPAFSSTASGTPYGWSSSPPSPTSSNRYVWQISRSRPAGGAWSSWGGASVVARYTERQTAYKRNNSSTTAPAFSSTASGTPYGWSSSPPSPTSSNRYVWRISRTRPAGGSWSSWGSASVVSRYTERQTAYKRNNSSTTAPAFSSTASGTPYGWSSSPPSPTSSNRYVWRISRTRPAGGSWSSWGSATVISTYTERQTAFRLHTSGTTAPSFSASASGVPSGWSSSRPTPNPHERYEWQIRRTRPTGGSWSRWGSATVVSTYTERQTAFRLHTSGTTAPSFSASASGVPSGWSSSRPTPNPHERYEWQIRRTRPTGGSWSNWGSATVVSTYTARQTTYRRNTSGTTVPAATSGTDSESPTIKVQRRLVMAPGGPSSLAAASGSVIGTMAGRIGMPVRRPKSAS